MNTPIREPGRVTTRYQNLDFWRGAACLSVLFYHSAYYVRHNFSHQVPVHGIAKWVIFVLDRGFLGVPLFFVISGYCITAACMGTKGGIKDYFLRRFRRIYPPAWACIGIFCILFAILRVSSLTTLLTDVKHQFSDPFALSASQWIGNLTLTETWLSRVMGRDGALLMGHYWSLCYEEQFYAVCGLALLLGAKPSRFFSIMLGVTIIVIVCVMFGAARKNSHVDGFFFDGKWLMFAAGIATYYRIHHANKAGTIGIDACLLLGTVAAVLVSRQNVLAVEVRTAFAFAVILCWLWKHDHAIVSIRLLRPVIWCGTMCYSLYLTHWPVTKIISRSLYVGGVRGLWPTVLISLPACLVASLLAAWLFHIWIERRFMNTSSAPRVKRHN